MAEFRSPEGKNPLGHEKLATLTSAKGLASVPAGATVAVITVEVDAVRFTLDGTTPTVTADTGLGHTADAGDVVILTGNQEINAFRVINETASNNAELRVTYF